MGVRILILLVGVTVGIQAQWLNNRDSGVPRTKDGKPNLSAPAPRASNGKADLSGVWQGEGAPISELMKILPAGVNGLGEDPPPMVFFNVLAGVKPEESPLRPRVCCRISEERGFCPHRAAPCVLHALPNSVDRFFPFAVQNSPDAQAHPHAGGIRYRLPAIFTDGRKLPDDPQPSWLGYSVGKWEGDSLVVDTIGLNPFSPLDIFGHPHSGALHVTERFRRRDFGHMDLQVTIDDPKIYTKAFTYKINLLLLPDTDLLENFCVENEKDAAHVPKK